MNEFIDNSLAEDSEDEVYAQQQQHQEEEHKENEHEHSLQEQNLPLINGQKEVLQNIPLVQNYQEEEEEEQREHVLNVHHQQNNSTIKEKYDNTTDTMHPLQPIDGNFMAEYDADKRESDYNSLTVLINTLEEELARTDDKNAKELQLHIEQNKNLRLQVEKLLYKRLTYLRSFVEERSTTRSPEEINNDEEEEEKSSEFTNGLVLLESAYRMRLIEEEEDEYIHLLGQTSQ